MELSLSQHENGDTYVGNRFSCRTSVNDLTLALDWFFNVYNDLFIKV